MEVADLIVTHSELMPSSRVSCSHSAGARSTPDHLEAEWIA